MHLSWVHLDKHFWKGLVKLLPRNPGCRVGNHLVWTFRITSLFQGLTLCKVFTRLLQLCVLTSTKEANALYTALNKPSQRVVNFFMSWVVFFNSFSPYLPFLKEQRQGEKTCFHKLHLKYDSRAIIIASDMQFRTIFGYYKDHMHSFIFVFIFCLRFRFFQPLICNKNKGYTVRTFLISTL